MKMNRLLRPVLAIVLLSGTVTTLHAGFLNIGGPADNTISSSDFSYFGSTQTKWEPGANTASTHSFSPPDGPETPGGATWSIMPSGLSDASGVDTGHSGTTDPITDLGVSGFSTSSDYENVFDDVLDVWASVSGFTNLGQVTDGDVGSTTDVDAGAPESSDGHLGDIRFAAWEISSSGVLAHGFQPGTEDIFGSGGTIGGDTHFDVSRTWVDDPSDTGSGDGDFDLYTTALHEVGHALGLGHSSVEGSVMEPNYEGARRTLHSDDIAGIQALYGESSGVIPEPSSLTLLGLGAIGLAGGHWRRRRKKQSELAA